MTKAEQAHLLRIKNLPCCICDASAPSDAHHVTVCGRRVSHYATVPLCKSCHQDQHNGIHGNMAMWKIMKMDEIDALARTIEMLVN